MPEGSLPKLPPGFGRVGLPRGLRCFAWRFAGGEVHQLLAVIINLAFAGALSGGLVPGLLPSLLQGIKYLPALGVQSGVLGVPQFQTLESLTFAMWIRLAPECQNKKITRKVQSPISSCPCNLQKMVGRVIDVIVADGWSALC
jgi:hypothetical protein